MCHRPLYLVFGLVALIALSGCRAGQEGHDFLQGDWLFYNPDAWCQHVEEIDCGYEHVLSVRGDSLRYLPGDPLYGWHRFDVQDDIVVVHLERSEHDYRPAEAELRLIATGDARLAIAYDPGFRFHTAWPDTLHYVRARSDCGDSGLTRIALSRGYSTHGPVPDFDVELARDGSYFYSGHALVNQVGTFRATDQHALFERISGLVASYPVDRLLSPPMEEGGIGVALLLWFEDEVLQYRGSVEAFDGLHLIIGLLSETPKGIDLEPLEQERAFAARTLLLTGELTHKGGT